VGQAGLSRAWKEELELARKVMRIINRVSNTCGGFSH
jgi:hypothetical protein